MRLSAKADYACLAMLELAATMNATQPTRIKAIADTHQIPQRFLVQILLQLKTSGLVKSVRGASGGYNLARKPENISIADVIRAVDDRALAAPKTLIFRHHLQLSMLFRKLGSRCIPSSFAFLKNYPSQRYYAELTLKMFLAIRFKL